MIKVQYKHILEIAAAQSAADVGCTEKDLFGSENLCVPASVRPRQARTWLPEVPLLHMVSYGPCAVAQAAPDIEAAMKQLLHGSHPAWMYFQPDYTARYTRVLRDYGFDASIYLDTCFLPAETGCSAGKLPKGIEVRILRPKDFRSLYLPVWANALSVKRPQLDVLAVGAYDGNALVGLAGCSAETAKMWQIGVDVLPAYRGRGIAANLVRTLAEQTALRGFVPYYTAAAANIASIRTAGAAGFAVSWVQLTAMPQDKPSEEAN